MPLMLLIPAFTLCAILQPFTPAMDVYAAPPTSEETATNESTTTDSTSVTDTVDSLTTNGGCHDPNNDQFDAWTINLYDPTCDPCATTTGATAGTLANSSGLSGMTGEIADGAKVAYDYLVAHGLSSVQALGVVGNLRVESGDGSQGAGTLALDTNALNSYGKTPSLTASDQAYGIAQWLHGRKTSLQQLANYDDINVQLDYLWNELTTSYESSVLTPLKQATSIDDAAMIFDEKFEAPCASHQACAEENAKRATAGHVAAQLMGLSEGSTASGTVSPLSAISGTASCSSSGTVGTISGLPDGGVTSTQEAWAIAQMFINDLNIIRVGAGAPFKNITDTSLVGHSQPAGTPGPTAKGQPCFPNASDCTQCYAFSAWFVDKFTTLTMGTVTSSGDGVVDYLAQQGVQQGTTAQVYSVFSMGRQLGDSGAHTGVVVGIVGGEAITVENNYGPNGGELVVGKRPIDGGSFDSAVGGRQHASFAYVSSKFASSPKTFTAGEY